MVALVVGRFDVDTDETYIDDKTLEALEGVNEYLCDGLVGEAAVMLGELLDLLHMTRVIQKREQDEFDAEYCTIH